MHGPSFKRIGEKIKFFMAKNRVQAGPQWKPIYMLILEKRQRTESGVHSSTCNLFTRELDDVDTSQVTAV